MSRRTQLYLRSMIQAGVDLKSPSAVLSRLNSQHKPSGKRYEKLSYTDKNGEQQTTIRAVGAASCAMKPDKAARLAARLSHK